MGSQDVVGDLDIAILCVAAFFLFFLGLVYYLRQEDKREGYPLELASAAGGLRRTEGFPPMPRPKLFHRPHGRGAAQAPRQQPPPGAAGDDLRGLDGFPVPSAGDALEEGIGAAAWQRGREDAPDLNVEGTPKIVPLSRWPDYFVAPGDPDPRGYAVVSADGLAVGTVRDLWFNRAEFFLRYLEFRIEGEARGRLLPLFFAEVSPERRQVRSLSLSAADLRRVPVTASADVITMLEEDRVNGFHAGGFSFSRPAAAPGRP